MPNTPGEADASRYRAQVDAQVRATSQVAILRR
jgi:hypothetical protein